MKFPFFGKKTSFLIISLLANVALLIACAWLFSTAKSFYTDYRHFRALGVGTSDSSTLPNTNPVQEQTRVVLYGDSRVQNWIPLPAIDNTEFINAGINGETTTEMRRRFEHDVLRHHPHIVVIQAGVNDLTASVTRGINDPQKLVDDMHSNMKYFITTLLERDIQVVLTSIFPNNTINIGRKLFWYNTLTSGVNNSNKVLREFTQETDGHWLDLSSVFYNNNDKLNSTLYYDTLHINSTAYNEINKLLENLLLDIARL